MEWATDDFDGYLCARIQPRRGGRLFAGGVPEIIDDFENGTPGDAHALAELRSNGDLRDKLVENDCRTAHERFGTRSYVDGVGGF
ncbi:hypothetical protein VSR82_01345 [Burkholderia sp. JPY481]